MDQIIQENTHVSDSLKILHPSETMVIEFVGLPGSGKSTNCKYISEILRANGFKIIDYYDLKNYYDALKPINRLRIIFRALIHRGNDFIRFFWFLTNHGIYRSDSFARYIRLCLLNEVSNQIIAKHKPDAILLDQWIIQGLWSSTIFKLKSFDVLHNSLGRFYFNTDIVVYIDLDAETASERIASRGAVSSRFDRLEAVERLKELKNHDDYLIQLFENSTCTNKMKFSAKASPVRNAEEFFEQFLKITNNE